LDRTHTTFLNMMQIVGVLMTYGLLAVETLVVLLLVLPMPSNAVRGFFVNGLQSMWSKHVALRYLVYAVASINSLIFFAEVKAHPGLALLRRCEDREMLITAAVSLFMFLVMKRLLDIQALLHQSRVDLKDTAESAQMASGWVELDQAPPADTPQPSAPPEDGSAGLRERKSTKKEK